MRDPEVHQEVCLYFPLVFVTVESLSVLSNVVVTIFDGLRRFLRG